MHCRKDSVTHPSEKTESTPTQKPTSMLAGNITGVSKLHLSHSYPRIPSRNLEGITHLHLDTFINALSREPVLKEKLFLMEHGSLQQLTATVVRIENFLEMEKNNRRQLHPINEVNDVNVATTNESNTATTNTSANEQHAQQEQTSQIHASRGRGRGQSHRGSQNNAQGCGNQHNNSNRQNMHERLEEISKQISALTNLVTTFSTTVATQSTTRPQPTTASAALPNTCFATGRSDVRAGFHQELQPLTDIPRSLRIRQTSMGTDTELLWCPFPQPGSTAASKPQCQVAISTRQHTPISQYIHTHPVSSMSVPMMHTASAALPSSPYRKCDPHFPHILQLLSYVKWQW
jgi:hypothetical protein